MVRVALTGGIATGKSYCLERFASLGAATVDADVLARQAVDPGSPGLRAVVRRFGNVLQPDGSLDRAALGRIVFADSTARADLEAIIHPEVYQRIRRWFAALPPATGVAIADIPLLFETGHQHEFDRVVVASCHPDEQLRRLVTRDHLSTSDARARLAAQWPIDAKASRADFVVKTDGSFAETDEAVGEVYESLKAEV